MAEAHPTIEVPPASNGHISRLALRPAEAAKSIGIGERLLWTLTNQGIIRSARLGRSVVYPIETLAEDLRRLADGKGGLP